MNKKQLVKAVSDTSGLSKTDVTKSVDAMIASISKALKAGDNIRLVGFGTFLAPARKARTGRNPLTGESVAIKASKQPKFRAGQILRDFVND